MPEEEEKQAQAPDTLGNEGVNSADAPKVIPSCIHIEFDGPGSAMIRSMKPEGVVTTNQIAALGLILVAQALQDWGIPMTQRIIEATVAETVAEMRKPKIEAAGGPFFNPNMMKGGGGRPV